MIRKPINGGQDGWVWIAKSSPFSLPQRNCSVFSVLFSDCNPCSREAQVHQNTPVLFHVWCLIYRPCPLIFPFLRNRDLSAWPLALPLWHAQAEILEIREHVALQYMRVLVQAASQRQREAGLWCGGGSQVWGYLSEEDVFLLELGGIAWVCARKVRDLKHVEMFEVVYFVFVLFRLQATRIKTRTVVSWRVFGSSISTRDY